MSVQETRREKLEALTARGIQPYAYAFPVTHRSALIRSEAARLIESAETVRIAGRLMTRRGHSKACFAHLKDAAELAAIFDAIRAAGR